MYEPTEGAYLAAWLSPDMPLRTLEELTGKRHAVYVHEMFLGDEIPFSWLLQCMATMATPLLIIHPPADPEAMELPVSYLVVNLANHLGSLNLPMFVAFYPPGHGIMAAEYTTTFRMARNAFHAHAPMAAFVWVSPTHVATPTNTFYPGHNFVDWVALPLLATWDAEDCYVDILSQLETFYGAFHQHKPIMILPLGISHFTRGDYTYRIHQAAAEITRIYEAIQAFPRVGLVAYADAFNLHHAYTDDFSISIERQLLAAYADVISSDNFLSSLERNAAAIPKWTRSIYHGYAYDDRIYISIHTLQEELSTPAPRQTAQINDATFAEAYHLLTMELSVCHALRVIYVEKTP